MSRTDSNPNSALAGSLRELADWLEANPDLPDFRAYLRHNAFGEEARETLNRVALALGDRAVESYTPSLREVTIRGEFGSRVCVTAGANPEDLGGVPAHMVTPQYPPIIVRA